MTKTINWCITYAVSDWGFTDPIGDWSIAYPVGDTFLGRIYVEADSKIAIDDLLDLVSSEHLNNTEFEETVELPPHLYQGSWDRKCSIQVYDPTIGQNINFCHGFDKGWICLNPEPVIGYRTHFAK